MELEWIDATDSVPVKDGYYIVCLAYNEVTVCQYDDIHHWFCNSLCDGFDDEDILFWMPLPPAPTGGE